jgi:hypothetical protein
MTGFLKYMTGFYEYARDIYRNMSGFLRNMSGFHKLYCTVPAVRHIPQTARSEHNQSLREAFQPVPLAQNNHDFCFWHDNQVTDQLIPTPNTVNAMKSTIPGLVKLKKNLILKTSKKIL